MRLRALLIGSTLWLGACSDAATVSSDNTIVNPSSGGSGGTTGGTTTGVGGASGASASGGGVTTGGATLTGGAPNGGTLPTGGGTTVSCGTTASGGSTLRGGSTGLGGTLTGGGPPATGGAATGGSGQVTGGSATGGTSTGGTATGGTPPCTTTVGTLKPPYTFPQNFKSSYCIYPPTACAEDARTVYNQWKQELVTSDGAGGFQRVRRPENEAGITDSTVSEGIGYGMILAVFMDDQTLFDNLWQYSQIHLNGNGLMIWLIEPGGQPGIESGTTRASGSATDADEDMTWALAMAEKKWGGRGSLGDTYGNLARAMMGRIIACERDTRYNMLNAGDSWGTVFAWNPSYFAPNQYRLFAKLDTTTNQGIWDVIIDNGYTALANAQNQSSAGLVPAWTDQNGTPTAPSGTSMPTHYQYDAARVPFRIAQDYCDTGDSRAKAILDKLTTFFSGIGAANIVDGYNLDGSQRPEPTTPAGVQSALFVGAAGVGAMSTTNQAVVDSVYARLLTQPDSLMLPKSRYFNLSWKVFAMLMMSGNLFDYTLHP